MKAPKVINTYCPKCNKKTEHAVSLYKAGKQRALSHGAIHHEKDTHGYGGQKFPELKRSAKTSKKEVLRLRCRVCGYTLQRKGTRLKKIELAD
ncbi:MAG: 50S ribosomal protein L44e [Candidatus Bathyarchaeia archaeon]